MDYAKESLRLHGEWGGKIGPVLNDQIGNLTAKTYHTAQTDNFPAHTFHNITKYICANMRFCFI